MKVNLIEIEHLFNDLISEKKSREEIALWASDRQAANDEDTLEFEPLIAQKRIWRAITFLLGVDLKDIDGSYLHSIDNFIEFKNSLNL